MVWDRNGSCYTGGIDAHHADGWIVEHNDIRGFWCSNGLSEHGIHFWVNSSDTVVQCNNIFDCDRGIGFGLGKQGHKGGVIRNNIIYHGKNHGFSDASITLESANKAQVYNNTIFQKHNYPNAIEYRFAESRNIVIKNNLTNREIASRQGGTAKLISNNNTTATTAWLADTTKDNLHLNHINVFINSPEKQNNSQDTKIYIGANECSSKK